MLHEWLVAKYMERERKKKAQFQDQLVKLQEWNSSQALAHNVKNSSFFLLFVSGLSLDPGA